MSIHTHIMSKQRSDVVHSGAENIFQHCTALLMCAYYAVLKVQHFVLVVKTLQFSCNIHCSIITPPPPPLYQVFKYPVSLNPSFLRVNPALIGQITLSVVIGPPLTARLKNQTLITIFKFQLQRLPRHVFSNCWEN